MPRRYFKSSGVNLFLLAHTAAVSRFQLAEDNRRQDGESTEEEEGFVDAVNHSGRTGGGAIGNEERGG